MFIADTTSAIRLSANGFAERLHVENCGERGQLFCWWLGGNVFVINFFAGCFGVERAAQHSGVNVERLRAVSIAATALLTSAAVAYAGIVAFIGLIIPHLLRMILGRSNRWCCRLALGGAC